MGYSPWGHKKSDTAEGLNHYKYPVNLFNIQKNLSL